MTTVRAVCPPCGTVEITAPDVHLLVCAARPELSTYGFACPACHMPIEKPAPHGVVVQLLSAGVTPHALVIPAEVLEPHDGPPLGYDDLLDLALELAALDVS